MKFNHLLPPRVSGGAQFTVYWVCVKDKDKWYLSKDGDIKFCIGNFGRGKYNEQFWFDFDYEAWCAIIRYYRKHDVPFPYMKNITEQQFIPPAFHRELLAIYGEDNIWWKTETT